MPNQQNNFIRPSSMTYPATNVKQPFESSEKAQRRTSILILTLLSIIIFLFVLSLLLICALVVVGKNLSVRIPQSSESTHEISSILLLNRALNNVNKNTIESSDPKFHKKYNMSLSKVVDSLTFRLPRQIKPIAYNLFLHPDLKNRTFAGNVKIDFKVTETMPYVALHSKFLNISQVKLMKNLESLNGAEGLAIKNSFEYEKFEYFIVEPEDVLDPGNYSIDLNFDGRLDNKIVGFYGSTYFDEIKNQSRYIATSKFEPTFARQSFPCFDEPSMKAKFKISLISPDTDDYHALSNMDVESIEDYQPGLKKYNFAESVPMSTYLTVFIVSDFKSKSVVANASYGEPFPLSVFSRPGQIDKTDFALSTSKAVIEFYIDYFQIPYPLPKLDLAGIPDFVSGAMETWGLITYRETNLLYDTRISSTANKQRIAAVIAHEFAHMWFGNLVTMKFWNDLWLNEGFASYIEFKGITAAHPTWKMEDQFTIDTMHSVLDLDATLGSHPIVVGVETPDQITEIFDSITYNKGASVIRMIEDFIGPENFRNGITDYLNEMRFGNADSDDLLRNLKKYTDLDVSAIVNTWIRQKGIPIVSVERVDNNNIQLTQKRFLTDAESAGKETVESEYNYRWSIPVTYKTNLDENVKREWFLHQMDKLVIDAGNVTWIKINVDQVGYYRVKYEQSMWESLTDVLKVNIDTLSILDRAHLLNDVFSLAQGQLVEYSTALKMTEFLQGETSFIPWSVASTKLKKIRNLLYNTEYYTKFKKYVNNLVDGAFKSINWNINPEEHLNNLHRNTILDLACSMDHPECMQKVGEMFKEWLNADPVNQRPHPDLRSLIYYYGMRIAGSEKEWNLMFEIFANELDASEKAKLQSGLCAVQDPVILNRFIELASADETYVRKQDYFSFMASVAGNRAGEMLIWDYVRQNWPSLVERFGLSERNLGRMIPTVTSRFASEIRLQEMQDFFRKYPEAGAGANARKQALENIQNNIKWLKNNKSSVGEFLQSLK